MGTNLQVPIELIGIGVASSASTDILLKRSEIDLDTADYDGSPTYYFEVCCQNQDTSAKTVSLMCEPSAGVQSISGATFATATDGADNQFAWTDPTSGLIVDGNYAVATNPNAFAGSSNSLKFTDLTTSPLSAIPSTAVITNIHITVTTSGSLATDGLWQAGLIKEDGTKIGPGGTLYNQQTLASSDFTPTRTFEISGTPAMWQWDNVTPSTLLSGGFYMYFYLTNQNDSVGIDGVSVMIHYENWDTISNISVPVTSGATYSGATNYSAGTIVSYAGLLYIAIQGPPNQNKTPSSNPAYWQKQDQSRYRSSALTMPSSGAKRFRLKVPGTTANSNLTITEARLLINQTDASKTRIQIPIIDGKSWNTFGVGDVGVNCYTTSKSLGGAGVPNDNGHGMKWNYNLTYFADYADGNCMTFEAIKYDDSYETTSHYATLFDVTSAAEVTAARLQYSSYGGNGTYNGTLPFRRSVDFPAIGNLVNGRDYAWKTDYESGNNNDFSQEARLYVRLKNLTKTEIYYRLVKATSSGKGLVNYGQSKMYLDTSLYSSPVYLFDGTGTDSTNENNFQLMDLGASYDSAQGQPGTAVTSSQLAWNGATQHRRSSALTLTNGHRYGAQQMVTTGNNSTLSCFLVIQVTGSITVTTRPFFMVVG